MLDHLWVTQPELWTCDKLSKPELRKPSRAEISWSAGDVAKSLTVLLTAAFCICLMLPEHAGISETYLRNGFCVSSEGTHDQCFLANVTAGVMMLILVQVGRARGWSAAATDPIQKNAVSLAGHGAGHGLISALSWSTASPTFHAFEQLSLGRRLVAFLIFLPVWFGFMRDARRSTTTALAFAAFHNGLQLFLLPTTAFFTHVLIAVLLSSALRKMAQPAARKTLYYDLESWLVDVPILLMTFGEALTCDAGLLDVGGHVWFDMVVPAGFVVYFAILLHQERSLCALTERPEPRPTRPAAPSAAPSDHTARDPFDMPLPPWRCEPNKRPPTVVTVGRAIRREGSVLSAFAIAS